MFIANICKGAVWRYNVTKVQLNGLISNKVYQHEVVSTEGIIKNYQNNYKNKS